MSVNSVRYRAVDGVCMAKVADLYLLTVTEELFLNGMPHLAELNASAAFFWEQMEEGRDLEEIIQQSAKHFGLSADELREDVVSFFCTMQKSGYIKEMKLEII